MTKIACKYGRTIETISTTAIDNDGQHAHVEVTRWQRDIDGNYQYVTHTYKVSWYNIGMVMLRDWAGQQSFGHRRGKIDIRQNAYVYSFRPAVYYNIHRLKRRETTHQW